MKSKDARTLDAVFKIGILGFLFLGLIVGGYLIYSGQTSRQKSALQKQHQVGDKFKINGKEVYLKSAVVSDGLDLCDDTISRTVKVHVDYRPGLDKLYVKMLTTTGVIITDSHGNSGDQMEFFVPGRFPGNQNDADRSYKLQFIDGSEATLIPFQLEFRTYARPTQQEIDFLTAHGIKPRCTP